MGSEIISTWVHTKLRYLRQWNILWQSYYNSLDKLVKYKIPSLNTESFLIMSVNIFSSLINQSWYLDSLCACFSRDWSSGSLRNEEKCLSLPPSCWCWSTASAQVGIQFTGSCTAELCFTASAIGFPFSNL